MPTMRIVHCISSIDPRAGGPAVAVAGLAGAQAALGQDVTVVASFVNGADDSAAAQLETQGARVVRIGPCHGPLGRHPALKKTVQKVVEQADVVHIHGLWEEIQYQAARAARTLNKPYVIRPCGMLTRWSLNQSRWKKRLYMRWRLWGMLKYAAAIHFATPMEREESAGFGIRDSGFGAQGSGGAPAIVEPLGVDLREFETLPPAGKFRAAHGIAADRPLIVFLGRIHPGKGLEYLVPALAKLKNADALLAIVGPDSHGHRATVEQRVAALGLRERVLFTGMLRGPDRVAALADADLFCLPSDHENFGVSVIEALAAGTPVIVSDRVAIAPAIADAPGAGVGGVTPCDPDALAGELDRWLADPAVRAQAAAQARPFVWNQYDWKQIAGRWRGHYSNWIGATAPNLQHA